MGVYGVYDYDFFHYENVIPNLECAKIVSYYRTHNEIAVLVPEFNPAPYTQFFTRKEYDDGIYPKQLFEGNCVYGGRAFNPNKYQQLEKGIELTVPDMHIYDRYIEYFGKKPAEIQQIKRILNCAHMRLAPDSENLLDFDRLKKYLEPKVTGIFLHDYNLAKLKCYDLLKELQDLRRYKKRDAPWPYPVGNKYPIQLYDSKELQEWLKIVTIPNAFNLEYCGLMDDTVLNNLVVENRRMARQIYYNITWGCSSENDFFINRLPKIFIQSSFLRRAQMKILLVYDEDFFVTKELEKFIELLNCWLSFQFIERMPVSQTLFTFCRANAKLHYTTYTFRNVTVTIEESREIFQYIREKNYNLFKKFYEWDHIIYEGGKLRNERTGDSE